MSKAPDPAVTPAATPPRAEARPAASVGRRLLSNVASLGSFKILADICTFAMFLVLARAYGREGIGEYSFAMALTGFVALLANFGFEFFAVREVARDPSLEGTYFGSFILLSLLLCPVLWGLTWVAVHLLGYGEVRASVLLVICAYQLLYYLSQVVIGRFKARHEMIKAGALEAGLRVGILGGFVLLVVLDASLVTALLVVPLATALYTLVAGWMLARTHAPLVWRLNPPLLRRVWPEVWPFGVATLLKAACTKIDVVMLGMLRDEAEVGTYAAAHRPIFGFITVLAVMSYAAFPLFSRMFVESREGLRRTFGTFVNYMLLFTGGVALTLAIVAAPVVRILYGEEFEATIPVLQVFCVFTLVSCLNVLLIEFLGAINRQTYRMRSLVLTIVLNVILNAVFISRYGAMGALGATILSEVVLLVLVYAQIRRDELSIGLLRILGRVAIAGGAGYGITLVVHPPWAALLAGLAVFGGAVLMLGGVRRKDLALLQDWMRRRNR